MLLHLEASCSILGLENELRECGSSIILIAHKVSLVVLVAHATNPFPCDSVFFLNSLDLLKSFYKLFLSYLSCKVIVFLCAV